MLENLARLSYNNWLREESRGSLNLLVSSTEALQVELSGLASALQQEITMEPLRVFRVTSAIEHLIVEIHLLATLKVRGKTD